MSEFDKYLNRPAFVNIVSETVKYEKGSIVIDTVLSFPPAPELVVINMETNLPKKVGVNRVTQSIRKVTQ